MAAGLLETGDAEAATEELVYAASHIARAILLARGVFPLSRAELPPQLKPYESELADALDRLIVGDIEIDKLKKIQHFLQDRLRQLTDKAAVPQA